MYTIHVRVIQTKPCAWYSNVEKTVWKFGNGGTWSEVDGEHILRMGGSGTSGTLRFKNAEGDYFLVALGVHNYKRWCDVVVDLTSSNTGMKIHPTYYEEGSARNQMLWKQLPSVDATSSKGVKVKVDYYKEDGNTNTYWATITISHTHNMSPSAYTTHVRVIQTKPSAWYSNVEKTVWNDGTWSEADGEHTLSMGGSGTSGTLRFKNAEGDYFLVALGVHNYKRWCDVAVDLTSSNTGMEIHPTYYGEGSARNQMLWKQLPCFVATTSKGVKVKVDYYKEDGNTNTYWATITIS